MKTRRKLQAIDFFCGAGGLTRGLLDAGVNVILGIDADDSCKETYTKNNKPSQFLCADISSLKAGALKPYLKGVPANDLLFAACAPCQPFARLNKTRPKGRDAFLLADFARFVRHYKPKFVFLENVPEIARIKGGSTLARFRRLLLSLRYNVSEGVVDAKHYGVPQSRRRYVLLAARRLSISIPEPTHGAGRNPFRTVEDAIGHFPPVSQGKAHKKVKNHIAAPLSPLNLERLRATPKNGGDRRSWPAHLVLKCHEQHDGHTDIYGRMAWNKPAPTLTCQCNSLSNGRYGHPEQNRAITLREAAALQSFRDSYVFYDTMTSYIARKIGNAVPVRLARAVGRHFLRYAPMTSAIAGGAKRRA